MEKSQLQFLVISCDPKDKVALGNLSWNSSKNVKFREVTPATFARFEEEVGKATNSDGFVFWGHGDINPVSKYGVLLFLRKSPDFKFLARFESHPIEAFALSLIFKEERPLLLAYVFACESAWWGERDLAFGNSVVGRLLQGTPLAMVVGAQTNLDVTAAEVCLEASLRAMQSNPRTPLDLALNRGRKAIYSIGAGQAQRYSALDWWVPVLYVKPTFLDELSSVKLLTDPSEVPLPAIAPLATATPAGGLSAVDNVTPLQALGNIAVDTFRNFVS